MVEIFHRQLKPAVKCHASSRWAQVLPTVLLDIRTAWRQDLQTITAELVYEETLRLSGQFLTQRPKENPNDSANFVKKLCRRFDDLRPIGGTRQGETCPFVFKNLKDSQPGVRPLRGTESDVATTLRRPVCSRESRRQESHHPRAQKKYNGLDRPG